MDDEGQKEFYKKVGSVLRELRLKKGLTQEQFALDYNFGRAHYGDIERGINITIGTLYKLLLIHNISAADFFSGFTHK